MSSFFKCRYPSWLFKINPCLMLVFLKKMHLKSIPQVQKLILIIKRGRVDLFKFYILRGSNYLQQD